MLRLIVLLLFSLIGINSNAAAEDSKAYSLIKSYLAPRVTGSGYLPGSDEKVLYLYTCSGPESIIGEGETGNRSLDDFTLLAYDVLDTSKALDRAGYPRSVWKPTLDRYEASQIGRIANGKRISDDFDENSHFLKNLAKLLNDYRTKMHKSSLREPYTGTPGCGAGEAPVYIKVKPKATRIQYINMLYFNLCQYKGWTPLEASSCHYWKDYNVGASSGMSGNYKILVTWPDGTTASRDLEVESLTRSKNDDSRTFYVNK
jgi:hypothetical protein